MADGYGSEYGSDYGNDSVYAGASAIPVSYYLGLITSQYQNSPKFLAMLEVILNRLSDATALIDNMYEYFDIDNAAGEQLDTIGEIVGQARNVDFEPSGFSPLLDDWTYRTLLKAKICHNFWDGTVGNLQTLWKKIFPTGKLAVNDGQNMTATMIMSGEFSSIMIDLITNGYILPRPQGVLYNYTFSPMPYFGFGINDEYVAGFGSGHWA